MKLSPIEQQEAVLRRQNKVSRARHAGRDAGDERFLRLARVRHPARDVDERRHVGMVASLGDHRSAVGVADEDDRLALLADDHLGRGDVLLERDGRVLHDPDLVAVVPQEVVDAPPAGAVRPSAVHEEYGGLGSILRVCAHGLLLSDPLSSGGSAFSTRCMVPPSAFWRDLRRIPLLGASVNKGRDPAVSSSCTMREAGSRGMRKILLYALLGVVSLAIAGLLRQRQRPIPIPPPLTFLFENPLVEAFAGSELLVERLGLAPGMRVLDAGCGPGRLTIPLARAVGPDGEVVALDGQRAMLAKLERRLEAEGITNVRPLRAGLGEGVLGEGGFDRAVLAMVLGEVRDRRKAVRELYATLEPGGVLSVPEIFGDPDYRRPPTVR